MKVFKFVKVLWVTWALVFGAVVSAEEVKLDFARYFFSDLSGSCEVCATFNGVIEVENIAPEKEVSVHYIGDFMGKWSSTSARFIGPSRPGYEYWAFSTGIAGRVAEFAIQYQVAGNIYWDNNQQSNYTIEESNPLFINDDVDVLLYRSEKPIIFRFPEKISYLGSVHVRNLAFEKAIDVRYSVDGWQTWQVVPAQFTQTERNGLERWTFNIDFPIDAQTVDLAVSYSVNNETVWDSNLGRNYRFQLPK